MSNVNKTIPSNLEEQLIECQEKMDRIQRWAGVGTWEWSVEAGQFDIDLAFLCRYGYTMKELAPFTLERWQSILHPDDILVSTQRFGDLLSGKSEQYNYLYRVRSKVGGWIMFHARGGVEKRDAEGKPLLFAGTIQDISNLKPADHRDRLLSASNEAASILLGSRDEEFDLKIWRVLNLLGRAAEIDRISVWKNRRGEDGRLYTTQINECSLGAKPQHGNKFTVDVALEETIPTWEKTLRSGECINNLVRLMSQTERDQLELQGVISVLVAPIIYENQFWGFIGVDDCTRERIWTDSESGIFKSAGMLIAAAIGRQQASEALEAERALLEQILDNSPIGVVITTDGIVEKTNPRYKELVSAVHGESIQSSYVEPEKRAELLEKIKMHNRVFDQEVQIYATDGDVRDIMLTMQSIAFDNKSSVLAWLIDITNLKKTEKDLILAKDLAEGGTRAKSEFLARMSHEIRTPMNAILGMAFLCRQTKLTEKQDDYLAKIQVATTNLLGIIDDILDFSKIEAGRVEIETIPFRLSKIVSEVVDVIEIKVKEKGLNIEVNIDKDVYDFLYGDPLRLRQILTNLTNNAVKFTDKGTISIDIKPIECKEMVDESIMISFAVTDSGIGMTDEQIKGLFKSFSQADSSTTRKYGGTGLGLAISKSLVELMGGHIGVESIPNYGTTFTFTIPFHKAFPTETSQPAELSSCRVLVVDDDISTCDILKGMVRSMNMKADAVNSGKAAIDALLQASPRDPFDLVLIDWQMPQMDGLETIEQIQSNEDIETQPLFLVISAYDSAECVQRAKDLNLPPFLFKPITQPVLSNAIREVFEKSQRQSDYKLFATNNIAGSKVLLVEDNKINQMVAVELLRMYGVEPFVANDGEEAVEKVKQEVFDLILMDIQMPVMDGLTAARIIRSLGKPETDTIPILAMTANAMDTDYRKSLEVGMNDHLTKPIDPVKLHQALESWIVKTETKLRTDRDRENE